MVSTRQMTTTTSSTSSSSSSSSSNAGSNSGSSNSHNSSTSTPNNAIEDAVQSNTDSVNATVADISPSQPTQTYAQHQQYQQPDATANVATMSSASTSSNSANTAEHKPTNVAACVAMSSAYADDVGDNPAAATISLEEMAISAAYEFAIANDHLSHRSVQQKTTAPAVVQRPANSAVASTSSARTPPVRYGSSMRSRAAMAARMRPKNLLDLPIEMLEKIFSYVGYKKVSQLRLVSKSMNVICSSILTSTFSKLSTNLMNRFRLIKNNMPRRESSRRTHPLSYECDVVETCYMRVSLLQMTFGKHMDRKHICFFAGAILDEVLHILHQIRDSPNIRPHTMTEELYDLSTMAMEYFKEHLEPRLPPLMPVLSRSSFVDHSRNNTKTKFLLDTSPSLTASTFSNLCMGDSDAETAAIVAADDDDDANGGGCSPASPPQSNMVLRKGIRKIKQGMKRYNNQLTVLRNDLRYCKRKAADQHKMLGEMQKLIAEQQKQNVEFAARLNENDKKNEEMSMKISTLLQESNKCKTELQYWRSKGRAPDRVLLADGGDDGVGEFGLPDVDGLFVAIEADVDDGGGVEAIDEQNAANGFVAIGVGEAVPAAADETVAGLLMGAVKNGAAAVNETVVTSADSGTDAKRHHGDVSIVATHLLSSDRRDGDSAMGASVAVAAAAAAVAAVVATSQPMQPQQRMPFVRTQHSNVAGNKRKADTMMLTDCTTTSASMISTRDNASSGAAAVQLLAVPTNDDENDDAGPPPSASSSSLLHSGGGNVSDIIKKPRRVQSKARGQQPHSIIGHTNGSCSSSSSSNSSINTNSNSNCGTSTGTTTGSSGVGGVIVVDDATTDTKSGNNGHDNGQQLQ